LLPIYPARELPLAGVSSEMIATSMTCPVSCLCPDDLQNGRWLEMVWENDADLLVTIGAGDIDQYLPLLVDRIMLESNQSEPR